MTVTETYRLLVVDDDEVDRKTIRRLLAAAALPCSIDECRRAADVRATADRYDCVLLDFQLPDGDGLGVLRRLRSESPALAVVMLTGHGDEQLAVQLMKAGAADYVAKGAMSADRLAASIRQAVRAARAEEAARLLAEERRQLLQREREARREAEEASAAKDQFLAMLSHELRTPLNAILGWARILRTGKPDAEKLGQGLETIERNARVQAQLIEDLLDVSRIVSGKLRLDLQPTDPSAVVAHALDAVRVQAQARGIELQERVTGGGDPILADPGRLQQVVWNLLSNAIKFTPRGGHVRVALSRSPDGIEIVVRDDGQGIDPAFLPRVFDRFAQADAPRQRGGLGLGLAIVKHLVEQHGGHIEASSDGPGKGATFRVRLPAIAVAPAPVLEAHPAPGGAPRLVGVRVMVVDDNHDTRVVVGEALGRHGADVTAFSGADEALAALATSTPDVLVSDIEMPGRDGYALIEAVQRLPGPAGGLPAVALTGAARVEDRIRTLAAGYQMHVPKPVDPDELVSAVAALARRDATIAVVAPPRSPLTPANGAGTPT